MSPTVTEDARSSITRSFRFDMEMLKVLDEEAERMGISVNSLVGIVLRRYADFERYLSKIDMVVVNREILTSLLDLTDEDTMKEFGARLGESIMPDTVIFWKKELTERAVAEYIEKVICRYGRLGTYDEKQLPNGKRTIVIRHRLGKRGSKFLEEYLRAGLKHSIGVEGVFETTDSSVKFEMKQKQLTPSI